MDKKEGAQIIREMISNIVQNPSQFHFRVEVNSNYVGYQVSNTGGVGMMSSPTINAPVHSVVGFQAGGNTTNFDIKIVQDRANAEVNKQVTEALSTMASIADELLKDEPNPTLLHRLGDVLKQKTLPAVITTVVISILKACIDTSG